MSLILAIEPDRRQASKIATLARGPLKAELIVAETTERAVTTLGGRVPDLILTSMLLSPKDEAALADHLRELDAAGTHVQTLVIPVLGTPQRRSRKQSGLLKRLRGSPSKDATPDGCEPAVFAAQIAQYLERAAEERRAAALDDEMPASDVVAPEPIPVEPAPVFSKSRAIVPEPVVLPEADPIVVLPEPGASPFEPTAARPESIEVFNQQPIAPPEPIFDRQQLADAIAAIDVPSVVDGKSNVALMIEAEPVVVTDPWEKIANANKVHPRKDSKKAGSVKAGPMKSATLADSMSIGSGASANTADQEDAWQEIVLEEAGEPSFELVAEPIDLAAFAEELRTFEHPAPTVACSDESESVANPALAEFAAAVEAIVAADRPVSDAQEEAHEEGQEAEQEAALDEPDAGFEADSDLWMPLSLGCLWPKLDGGFGRPEVSSLTSEVEAEVAILSAECSTPKTSDFRLQAFEGVPSQPQGRPGHPERPRAAAPNPPAPSAERTRKKKPLKTPPPQDEWGLFDPEQCGFAALLAKFDEITDDEKPEKPRG